MRATGQEANVGWNCLLRVEGLGGSGYMQTNPIFSPLITPYIYTHKESKRYFN